MFKSLKKMTPSQIRALYITIVITFTLFNIEQIFLWSTSAARTYTGIITIVGIIQAMIVTIVVSTFAVRRELPVFPLWAIIMQIANATVIILLDFSEVYWSYSVHANSCMNVPLTKLDSFYFTLTTLTTVGYGDISPATETCRTIVSGQLVVGLIWGTFILALLVTRIASYRSVSSEQLAEVIKNNNTVINANIKVIDASIQVLQSTAESLRVNGDLIAKQVNSTKQTAPKDRPKWFVYIKKIYRTRQ